MNFQDKFCQIYSQCYLVTKNELLTTVDKSKLYRNSSEDTIKVPRFEEEGGFYSTVKSSATMSKIKSKNSKVEITLRKALWASGYRYRLHAKGLPGKPDIVFPRQRLVIFIDGDFWHGYNWEIKKTKLVSNKSYWIPKIERNIQRDKEVTQLLKSSGWHVIRFWEHQVKDDLQTCIHGIISEFKRSEDKARQ